MRGREITLWLDERWYDALSKQLKGETLEEHLENILDEMCNQLPQREYERISHELWAEQQAEEEAREAARRFAVFHVTENGSSDYILAEEKLELLSTARRLRSYIRKPPDEAPHRFVETLLHTQRISQEEFNSYVSERLDNTGRVVGAYDIDLDSGYMEAVSIMDGWKWFRIRDVSTAAYFAMKKGNAAPDERWRIFLDRLEERALIQEPEPEYLTGSQRLCAEDISFAEDIIQNDNLLEFYMEVSFNADDAYRSIFSLIRKSPTKRNNLLFVVNYTPVDRPDYRVGVPKKKQYKLIMDENGLLDKPKIFKAEEQECDHREYSFNYSLPGYGVAVFTY